MRRDTLRIASIFALVLLWAGTALGAVMPKPTPKPAAPQALFPAGDNFGCGFVDKAGKVVMSGFDALGDFSEGMALVRMGGRYGYIDTTGKAVIPPAYRNGDRFSQGLAAVKVGMLWGYLDKTGNIVIKPQFALASPFSEGLAVVQVDAKFGAIDVKGAVVIPATYEKMGSLSDGLIAVCQNGKWGYIDKSGKTIIDFQYADAGDFVNGLAPVQSSGKWGFIDKTGQWKVEAKYDAAKSFGEGLAPVGVMKRDVVRKDGKVVAMKNYITWGYMDSTGKEVIALDSPSMGGQFSEGLTPAFKDNTFGYMDKTGKMAVVLPYNSTEYNRDPGNFHNGLVRLEIGWRYGFVDATGKMVVPQQYKSAYPFSEGLAAVQVDNDWWGYIDLMGQMKIKPQFFHVLSFKNGLARMYNLSSGLIDRNGKELLDSYKGPYDEIGWYTDKVFAARINKRWGFYDVSGKTLIEPQFESVSGLGTDIAVVKEGDKYGFVDSTGQLIGSDYDDCGWLFSAGLLPVRKDGKYGFVDQSGKMVIDPQYDEVSGFTPDKTCAVRVGEKWGFINAENKFTIQPQYDTAICFANGLAAVRISGLWGFVDSTGKTVVKPQFKEVGSFSCGLAPVEVNGKWGYIDKTGKLIAPAKFDMARDFVNDLAEVRNNGLPAYVDTKGKVVWMAKASQLARQFPAGVVNAQNASQIVPEPVIGPDDVRVIKVKVAADQIFRKRYGWRAVAEDRLKAVSDVLERNFKIRLNVTSVVDWESPDFSGDETASSYRPRLYGSLERSVSPGDAEIIVAYTGQDSRSPVLGFTCCYLNKLIVYDVPAEDEKRCVITSVHEICHMFGATHVTEESSVMYWSNSGQDGFDDHTKRQITLMRDFDFGKGVASVSDDKIKALQAIFDEDHRTGESFPVALGYSNLGDDLWQNKNVGAAIQAYRKSAELEGSSPSLPVAVSLAEALIADDERVEGVEALKRCIGLSTIPADAAGCHRLLAGLLNGEFKKELGFITNQQPVFPSLPEIYAGYVLTRVDSHQALSEFQKLIDLEPENAAYHWDYGLALRERGQRAEALVQFEKACELKPNEEFFKSRIDTFRKDI